VAKPGASFAIGQQANLQWKYGSSSGVIGVTITKIEKGNEADLAPLDLGDKAKGMVPYYVRATVTNVGGTDLSGTSPTEFSGTLPDGSKASEVNVIGTFDKCDSKSAPEDFKTKGASFQTCALMLASSTTSVTGAEWSEDPYGDQPVTWK
jgi:hypothetical protein